MSHDIGIKLLTPFVTAPESLRCAKVYPVKRQEAYQVHELIHALEEWMHLCS
jgi:hypothetical protein